MATATRSPAGIALAEKRSKVVSLRIQGKTLEAIAKETGLAGDSSVRYHLDQWLATTLPSTEVTEELRQLQTRQIDALTEYLWPRLETDDYLAVTDRLVKLMDRKARLMGLDLQRDIQVNVLPSAEQFAAALGWDEAGVIEGTATEVTSGDA